MKSIKIALTALILCSGFALQVSAKQKIEPRYLFGFAASFADSTVYFTDIQKVDSAWIDTKTKFLLAGYANAMAHAKEITFDISEYPSPRITSPAQKLTQDIRVVITPTNR